MDILPVTKYSNLDGFTNTRVWRNNEKYDHYYHSADENWLWNIMPKMLSIVRSSTKHCFRSESVPNKCVKIIYLSVRGGGECFIEPKCCTLWAHTFKHVDVWYRLVVTLRQRLVIYFRSTDFTILSKRYIRVRTLFRMVLSFLASVPQLSYVSYTSARPSSRLRALFRGGARGGAMGAISPRA